MSSTTICKLYNGFVHSILNEKNHIIVGEDVNRMKEQVLVVQWVFDNDIWFILYSERYKAINNHPRIMASYVSSYEEDPYIKIDDILVVNNDVGNGSILMPYFIKYCKTTDAKYNVVNFHRLIMDTLIARNIFIKSMDST